MYVFIYIYVLIDLYIYIYRLYIINHRLQPLPQAASDQAAGASTEAEQPEPSATPSSLAVING